MKLLLAIIHDRDKGRITDALLRQDYKFTIIGSTGGFLREGNITMLLGVEPHQVDSIINLIRDNCKSREQYVNVLQPDAAPVGTFFPTSVKVVVGGAVVWVIDVERFERC